MPERTAVRWAMLVVAILAVIVLLGYVRGDDGDDGRSPELGARSLVESDVAPAPDGATLRSAGGAGPATACGGLPIAVDAPGPEHQPTSCDGDADRRLTGGHVR